MNDLEKLIDIISQSTSVNKKKITRDSKLIDDLGLSSFDTICLLSDIEKLFDIEIDTDEVDNIETVGDVYDYCMRIVEEAK